MEMAWSRPESPFHEGELRAQEKIGVRDKVDLQGRLSIRDYMPEQHRRFYRELSFVLLGSLDADGRPWATMRAGAPGFAHASDERTLVIAAEAFAHDPAAPSLAPGAPVGVLGIQPETRRRNRLNGTIGEGNSDGLTVMVGQTFGNCPKFIQTRKIEWHPRSPAQAHGAAVERTDSLGAAACRIIEASDTFFIATAFRADSGSSAHGADVSHRGGRPGFVKVEDERTFVFPDFSGNRHFNTIGNILMDARTGCWFADFETGDVLYLTGRTEIVWDGAEVDAFDGAERLMRFRLDEAVLTPAVLPLKSEFGGFSPTLARTGDWSRSTDGQT